MENDGQDCLMYEDDPVWSDVVANDIGLDMSLSPITAKTPSPAVQLFPPEVPLAPLLPTRKNEDNMDNMDDDSLDGIPFPNLYDDEENLFNIVDYTDGIMPVDENSLADGHQYDLVPPRVIDVYMQNSFGNSFASMLTRWDKQQYVVNKLMDAEARFDVDRLVDKLPHVYFNIGEATMMTSAIAKKWVQRDGATVVEEKILLLDRTFTNMVPYTLRNASLFRVNEFLGMAYKKYVCMCASDK